MSRNTPTGSAKFQCKTAGCMVGRSCHPSVFRKGESDAQIRQDIPTSKEFGSDMQFSPRRSFQQHQDHAVDRRCQCPEGDDRPGHGEHLRRHTGDESLCLCQDRDEGNFCPILLGFWLLKFLKKSAFFAKLL